MEHQIRKAKMLAVARRVATVLPFIAILLLAGHYSHLLRMVVLPHTRTKINTNEWRLLARVVLYNTFEALWGLLRIFEGANCSNDFCAIILVIALVLAVVFIVIGVCIAALSLVVDALAHLFTLAFGESIMTLLFVLIFCFICQRSLLLWIKRYSVPSETEQRIAVDVISSVLKKDKLPISKDHKHLQNIVTDYALPPSPTAATTTTTNE